MSDSSKVGDVVILKSGGPKMTVTSVEAENCICIWFNRHDDVFTEAQGLFKKETLTWRIAPIDFYIVTSLHAVKTADTPMLSSAYCMLCSVP